MKILITGAAGGIGSTLGYFLNRNGHDLILVDNLRNGYMENLIVDGETFGRFYEIDINSDDFHKLVSKEKPDAVVHLAAITSLPDCEVNYRECIRCNVEGTSSVLGAARKSGIEKIIFASTSAVYENTLLGDKGFSESDEINPRLFYSLSKKMAEEICTSFSENYGMNITTLRFFNVFGPRQDIHRKSPPLINYIVRELKNGRSPILHSDGEQSRDYVYVNDVVDLIEKCLNINSKGYSTFNVSSGTLTSVKNILETVKEGIALEKNIDATYRKSDKLWDSYYDLFEGKFPLRKTIVEKETIKKSMGNNNLSKKILNWDSNPKILDLIKSMCSLIKI
jgi:nucleoside-diphosphate-sugar epimerase